MRNITLLYGLPCSGKTTVLEIISSEIESEVVKIDDVWNEIFVNPTFSQTESEIVFENFLTKTVNLMKLNISSILLEGVFASEYRLRIIMKLAKKNNYTFCGVLLNCSLEELLKRNEVRNLHLRNRVPELVIKFLHNKLNNNNLSTILLDTEKNESKYIAEIVVDFIKNGK